MANPTHIPDIPIDEVAVIDRARIRLLEARREIADNDKGRETLAPSSLPPRLFGEAGF